MSSLIFDVTNAEFDKLWKEEREKCQLYFFFEIPGLISDSMPRGLNLYTWHGPTWLKGGPGLYLGD